jgi:hypothetical protein
MAFDRKKAWRQPDGCRMMLQLRKTLNEGKIKDRRQARESILCTMGAANV